MSFNEHFAGQLRQGELWSGGLEVPPLGSSEIVLDSRVQKSSLQSFESEGLNKPLHYADLPVVSYYSDHTLTSSTSSVSNYLKR